MAFLETLVLALLRRKARSVLIFRCVFKKSVLGGLSEGSCVQSASVHPVPAISTLTRLPYLLRPYLTLAVLR